MRKGFIQIVEIIVISMMAFFLIVQFYQIPKQQTDWGKTELLSQANDILFSLERRGVDWFNSTDVDSRVRSFVSQNTIYDLKVRNSPKPAIKVGCICNGSETNYLYNALQYFEVNGQGVGFSVAQINPSSIVFSHEYDVIVEFDYDLAPYYTQIRQFLAAGRGLVEFRNLDQPYIQGNTVQSELFGLKWDGLLPDPNSDPVEFRSSSSSEPYYNIYKYFHHLPLMQENFTYGASRWTTVSGAWAVSNGNYIGPPGGGTLYSTPLEDSYSLRGWFMPENELVRADFIIYRQSDQNNVTVGFDASSDRIYVWENIGGAPNARGNVAYTKGFDQSKWYDVKIVPQKDKSLKIYVNGTEALPNSQPVNIPSTSQAGLGVAGPGTVIFDNVASTFSDMHNFTRFTPAKIWPVDNDDRKIILMQNRTLPACIVNSNIVGDKGRAAWLAPGSGSSQEINSMLRALVVWASGEENHIIKNEIKNVPVAASIYKVYDQEMYQPVQIALTLGNLYD